MFEEFTTIMSCGVKLANKKDRYEEEQRLEEKDVSYTNNNGLFFQYCILFRVKYVSIFRDSITDIFLVLTINCK